jgi:CBS domain-containing protein
MPTAGEFCNRRVSVARSGETLREIAARMRGEHVGSVVVVDELDGQLYPIGLLTDRDIVVAVLASSDRRHIEGITVGDVMSTEPVTAREEEDVEEVLEIMQSAGLRRVPIVSETGALAGIIAFDDIVEYVAAQIGGLAHCIARERAIERHARPATSEARRDASRKPPLGAKPRAPSKPAGPARSGRPPRVTVGRPHRNTR